MRVIAIFCVLAALVAAAPEVTAAQLQETTVGAQQCVAADADNGNAAVGSVCPRVISTGYQPARAAPLDAAQRCCKVCRKGKACGNSCIARWKNCHQPPGCACDG